MRLGIVMKSWFHVLTVGMRKVDVMTREEIRKNYRYKDNMRMLLKDIGCCGRQYYVYMVLEIILKTFAPILLMLLPVYLVGLLEHQIDLVTICEKLSIWIVGILGIYLADTWFHAQNMRIFEMLRMALYMHRFYNRRVHMDLLSLENGENTEMEMEIRQALLQGSSHGVGALLESSISLASSVLGLLLYAICIGQLQPFLLFLIMIASGAAAFAKRRANIYEYQKMGRFWENNGKFWGMKNDSINLEKAKDIRMYHLAPWFADNFERLRKEAVTIYQDVMQKRFFADAAARMATFLRDGAAYGYLLYLMINGALDVAQFLLYLGVISGFTAWMQTIVETLTILNQESLSVSFLQAYLAQEDKDQKEGRQEMVAMESKEVPEVSTTSQPQENAKTHLEATNALEDNRLKECHEIRFEDVSFAYPGQPPIFEHFNITLHANEKIALVGMNGAGKTTLVKLLCGLYPLTSGHIYVNDMDIAQIPHELYVSMLSIVFQDSQIFAFDIASNVACTTSQDKQTLKSKDAAMNRLLKKMQCGDTYAIYDEERILSCLQKAGLQDKIDQLPQGIHTHLTTYLQKDGILLSGGEIQKLMLARALYKKAPILILDEPTSALDPIAESELYQKYAQLSEGKISLFISHRLSSTRFADRILFLEHGKIIEEGSHEELLKKQGAYAKMFQMQAHYYQKEAGRNEEIIPNA